MTKLSSSLPGGDSNGLGALSRKLIDNPEEVHVVIALVDCKQATTDFDTGDTEPTARVRRIEAVSDDDRAVAHRMLRRALEKRTGKAVLPFDLEEDLRAAFGDINPDGDDAA